MGIEGPIQDKSIAHEMAKVENEGRSDHPRGALEKFKDKLFGDKKLEEAQERSEEVGEQMEKQKEMIKEFAPILARAASENTEYNILNGEVDPNLGPMEASIMNQGTSILVSFNNPTMMQGRVDVAQVSVDRNGEISVRGGAYDAGESFSADRKDRAMEVASRLVKEFQLYPHSR